MATNQKELTVNVDWQNPKQIPDVPKGETKEFWVAAKRTYEDLNGLAFEEVTVFTAQYVNMPVNIDENGETDTDDYLVDIDGDPLSAVGWFSVKDHNDFDNYYEPLFYTDEHVLLAWAEYTKPTFQMDAATLWQ